MLPVSTKTGSFLCLYVAVVPVCKLPSSISGTLEFVTFTPFTCVIYFLKAKSKGSLSGVTSKIKFSESSIFSGIITGCSSAVPVVHNVSLL